MNKPTEQISTIKLPISKKKAFLFAIAYSITFILTMIICSLAGVGIVLGTAFLLKSHPVILAIIVTTIIFVLALLKMSKDIYKEDQKRFAQEIKDSVKTQCDEENI